MLLSSFLDLLLGKIQKLAYRNVVVALILYLILVSFINGISLVPPEHYQRLSQNPFITRTDIDQNNYWQETVLLPVFAYFTHLNSRIAFNILCLFLALLGYFLFAKLTFQKYNELALIATVILISSPLTTVMLAWLGTPDSLTFALTVPFLFISSNYLIFILSVFGTLNHIAFMIAVSEILILRWIAQDNIKKHQVFVSIIGGIAGYLLVRGFLILNHIQTTTRMEYAFSERLISWVRMNVSHFPLTIFSLFNVHWLIFLVCLLMFFSKDKSYYFSAGIILLVNYGIIFFTKDTTRIFSLLSWGILMECIFHSYRLSVATLDHKEKPALSQKEFLQALIVIGLVSLIIPRYYAWEGEIHSTPFYFHPFFFDLIKQIIR